MSTEHQEDQYHVHPHISSTRMNIAVLCGLLFFTGLTVAAYRIHLGEWNLTVALLIATLKMILVATFFMHLKWERPFNTLFFVGAFVAVGIFLLYTTNDTHHRAVVDRNWGSRLDPRTGSFAYGTPPLIAEQGGEDMALPGTEAQGAAGGEATAPAEDAAPAPEGGAAAEDVAPPAEGAAPAVEGEAPPPAAEGEAPADQEAPADEAAPAGSAAPSDEAPAQGEAAPTEAAPAAE
jgi:cytochrome c oxidase subunit 4